MRFPMAILACRAAIPLVVVYSARFPAKALIRQSVEDVKVTFIDAQEIAGQLWTKFEIANSRAVQGASTIRSQIHCRDEAGIAWDGKPQKQRLHASDASAPLAAVAVESLHSIQGASFCRYDFYVAAAPVQSFCLFKKYLDPQSATPSAFGIAPLKTCL